MEENIKIFEPFFGRWYITKFLGSGACANVWEIHDNNESAALKEIRIALDLEDVQKIKYEGLDEKNLRLYVEKFYETALNEYFLMKECSNSKYVVQSFDYSVHKIQTNKGYEWIILILMERLQPIFDYFNVKPLTITEVIKLAIHVCKALEECLIHDIFHRDVAPKNIFFDSVSECYKLGDFGMARKMTDIMSFPEKPGTYAPPEVYLKNEYTCQTDLYALGVILYRMINDFRIPFLPVYPNIYTPDERGIALFKRYRGDMIPEPRAIRLYKILKNISKNELARQMTGIGAIISEDTIELTLNFWQVLLKAIQPDLKERFSCVRDMRIELESLFRK